MTPTCDTHSHTPAPLLTEHDVAKRLGLAVTTLRRWRWAGRGPAFHKFGSAIRYSVADINAYIAASVRRSTSDAGSAVDA